VSILCPHSVAEPYGPQPTVAFLPYHSFIAVRQKNDQAALSNPLELATADELVEDALRVVGEVSELCFPANERVRVALRVAELKTYNARALLPACPTTACSVLVQWTIKLHSTRGRAGRPLWQHLFPVTLNFSLWLWTSNVTYVVSKWTTLPNIQRNKRKRVYTAPFILRVVSKRSDINHPVSPANYTMSAFLS